MFIDVSELGEVEYIDVGGQEMLPSQADIIINFNHVNTIVASGNEIALIVRGDGHNNKLIYTFTSDREASKAKLALLERLNK